MENNNQGAPQYYDEYEIDLREYIMLLWNKKWFIAAFVIIAVVAAYVISANFIETTYDNSASAVVQLANTPGQYSETESVNQLLKSDEIVNTALNEVNTDLLTVNNLETEIISELKLTDQGMQGAVYGGIIQLRAQINSTNPNDAEELSLGLNAVLNEFKNRSDNYFTEVMRDKEEHLSELDNEINNLNQEIEKTNQILNNMGEVTAEQAFMVANVNDKLDTLSRTKREYINDYQNLRREVNDHRDFRVLNSPSASTNKIGPNIRLNMAIAAVLALMLAVFVIFFIEFMKED
ncbi:hypothetical protein LJ207_09940 [Halanaerobium sp. Z-7514]|uniref:Polysaccharide chain length determinant N-terminal domain-containing protein n=1 Tax=Halanaerobium polyolivorans TaxID=2886943 RepID=A0AAW4X1E0_9FIRM|nr:Wzz/FepE/Etk N-terminal domain-containing protein [Halanaerobium polyolivorans]MCC3145644.1 hypothetical protein [Halanaerobium polyolivorans]